MSPSPYSPYSPQQVYPVPNATQSVFPLKWRQPANGTAIRAVLPPRKPPHYLKSIMGSLWDTLSLILNRASTLPPPRSNPISPLAHPRLKNLGSYEQQ